MATYGNFSRPGRDGIMQSPSGSESLVKESSRTSKYSAGKPGDKNPCPDNGYDNLDEATEGNTSPREDEMAENTYEGLRKGKDKSGSVSPLDKDYAYKK